MTKDQTQRLQDRMCELALQEQEAKARAAKAIADREELTREYVFEVMTKEVGRDAAMRALQRIRLVEAPAKAVDIARIGPEGVPDI